MITTHPTAEVSGSAKIGENTIVWNEVQIRERVVVGKNCIISKGVYIDAGCVIGSNVKIQNYASIYSPTVIKDNVFIGPYVCFANDKYPRSTNSSGELKKANDWKKYVTTISKGSSIGAGCILLPGVTIGKFAMVGAGSVVSSNIPPNALFIGNPARLVGFVCECGAIVSKGVKKPVLMLCRKCQKKLA